MKFVHFLHLLFWEEGFLSKVLKYKYLINKRNLFLNISEGAIGKAAESFFRKIFHIRSFLLTLRVEFSK